MQQGKIDYIMFEQDTSNNPVKVRDLTPNGKLTLAAPINLRAEYNALKLDNGPQTPQALFLTATVPENVFAALDAHFATNYVVDLPPYQLERIERRYGDKSHKAYLTAKGSHVCTVRWGHDAEDGERAKTNTLTFQFSRCLEKDGARIARMVEAVANIANQLQTFASCPMDYAAPALPAVCGTSYGAKALAQLDTVALKINEGDLPYIEFNQTGLYKAGEYFLHEQGTGGKMYARKAAVWHRGQQIATVLWDARQATLEGTAKWEIMNRTLYDTTLSRESIVDDPVAALNSSVIKPFRADCAFDSSGLITYLEAVHARKIEAVRQRAYQKGKKYVNLATDKIEGFTFGSRSAGRYVRCYNKTIELETSKKDYIADYHKINGLEGEIGRLEMEMKSDYFRTLPDLDWRDLFDREKLIAITEQALNGWFDWVPVDSTDSKHNRRDRVTIIDFAQVAKSKYERQVPEPLKSDRMERILIKSLILRAEAATTDAAVIEHLQCAATIAENSSLWFWMAGKISHIQKDIDRRARLEEREVSDYFAGRSWYDALQEAYGDYQPMNNKNGELASIDYLTPLLAA
jgi:hypothetical protein